MEINTLDILKNLAIILVAAKLLGIVARKARRTAGCG